MVRSETLAELFSNSTFQYSDKMFCRTADSSITYTYSQFEDACRQMSSKLSRRGIGAGEKVAIFSAGHPNWPLAFFAATAFGRVSVPILPDFTSSEVSNILEHSESRVLFASQKCLQKITPETMERLDLVVEIETLRFVKDSKSTIDAQAKDDKKPMPDDLAVIIYTSGTTGSSKGVMLTHRNFISNIRAGYEFYPLTVEDSLLSVLPLSHAYELSLGMLYPFACGSSVCYISKAPTPTYLMGVLAQVRPTAMLIVPLLIEKIYKSAVLGALKKSAFLRFLNSHFHTFFCRFVGKKIIAAFGGRLRFLGIGGAKLDIDVERFLHTAQFPYYIGYGLTECAPLVCLSKYHSTVPGSIGYPIAGVEVRLDNVNKETGEGEIVVKGPNIMPGYYKDEERTARAFTKDGWFRTNDLAVADAAGRFFVKGRLGNMIVGASGENIYPEEIEKVFMEIPEIEDVIVVSRHGKLVALVKTVKDVIDMRYLEDKATIARIESRKAAFLRYVNAKVKANSRVAAVEIMKVPFEKTATLKIRRFLYVDSAPTV